MSTQFESAQDAEDAYYDAIEEGNLDAMMAVWEASAEVVCMLPMHPAHIGTPEVRGAWQSMLGPNRGFDISVTHLQWIEHGDIAIHLVEELVSVPDQPQAQPPIYATNIYRRGASGWKIIYHANAPTPPPPGLRPF